MTLLSVTAFAKTHGVSKAAAQKWQARGSLALREGKVDVERSDQLLQHAGLGRFNLAATGSQRQPDIGNRVAAEAADAESPAEVDLGDPKTVQSLNAFVQQLLTGNYADSVTAAVVKENALALKHVLAARQLAGELIDVETAERALFEAARGVRDAWMNFPTRAGPLIAAELGVETDGLVEVLSAHVHQLLADLGEPEPGLVGSAAAGAGLQAGTDAAAKDQHTGVG